MPVRYNLIATAVAAALLVCGVAHAQKSANERPALSSSGVFEVTPSGTPTAFFDVDISGVESPGTACPAGDTITVDVGANATITGVGWDVILETQGASWASEATIIMGSTSVPDQISLVVGNGVDSPTPPGGTAFSSGGIIDFTDIPIPNIAIDGDGQFVLTFCEDFVDNAGGVDAIYLAPSTLNFACFDCTVSGGPVELPEPQIVPVNNPWAILGLLGVIGLIGGLALTRRFS